MRKARLAAWLAAANLAALAVLLAGVEAVCSVFVEREWDNFALVYRLNHTWQPSSKRLHDEWTGQSPEFAKPYLHRYNRQGWLEDYDVSPAKAPGTYRVFYLGDSFTEGTAPMESSVPSVVERALAARGRVEVINTGTSSYSPSIFYVLARYVLLDYAPDLLVVNVDMTDVDDDWRYSATMIRDERGDPWAVPPRDLSTAPLVQTREGFVRPSAWLRLQLFLLRRSYAYNLLWRNRTRKVWGRGVERVELERPAFGWCRERWSPEVEKDVARTFDLLRRLARLCRERGVKLMLTGVPHHEQFSGAWSSRPHRELGRLAEELGVPYLDSHRSLRPRMAGAPRERYYYSGDMHFNPRGYGLWAQAHLKALLEPRNRLLPKSFYR